MNILTARGAYAMGTHFVVIKSTDEHGAIVVTEPATGREYLLASSRILMHDVIRFVQRMGYIEDTQLIGTELVPVLRNGRLNFYGWQIQAPRAEP